MERKITLDAVLAVDFVGPRGVNLGHFNSKFPLLKVVTRGSVVRISGSAAQMDDYEHKLELLANYYKKYGHMSMEIIDSVVDDSIIAKMPQAAVEDKKVTEGLIVYGNNGTPIKAATPAQKELVERYAIDDMIFGIGPAGSGKTYTSIALAVRALKNKEVKKLILTRPAVEAGEKLGFLPGDMKDKLDPYLQPLYDALGDMLPRQKLNEFMEQGIIQIAPLAYMRGRTLDNAVVILDEAQNTTREQLKMFLTRMGRNAKFLILGDMTQVDLPPTQRSGLEYATTILAKIQGISTIKFQARDIMRHPLVGKIVKAYEKE